MVKKVIKKKVSGRKAVKSIAKKRVLNKPILIGAARAWKGFALFAVLLIISLASYNIVDSEMYRELFFLLSFGFGAVSVALLIALLIYFFYSKIKFRK